jgi:hypothetical protein
MNSSQELSYKRAAAGYCWPHFSARSSNAARAWSGSPGDSAMKWPSGSHRSRRDVVSRHRALVILITKQQAPMGPKPSARTCVGIVG